MSTDKRTHTFGDDWEFRYRIDVSPPPSSRNEGEEYVRSLLAQRENECQSLRRDLLVLYRSTGRLGDALTMSNKLLTHARNVDQRCEALFILGQTLERTQDWESAIGFFEAAKECGTTSDTYAYFIENNIGYCLNQLGRFTEAQGFLRSAIIVDPERANAYMNYGLSCEGLMHFGEAADSYAKAVRADAADPSALHHLDDLVARHPGVLKEVPDLEQQIIRCRAAVAYAMLEWEKELRNLV
jgi:tetratricopeptide (TPR) repeat protein